MKIDPTRMWRVNPLIRGFIDTRDQYGVCLVPSDVDHCHGTEVQHLDDVAECINPAAGPCESPRSGTHGFVHHCAPDIAYLGRRRCDRCR